MLRDLRLEARTVRRPEQADVVVALRARADDPRLRRMLAELDLPLYVARRNTSAQIRRLLADVFRLARGVDEEELGEALREAEEAVARVREAGSPVALAPRPASVRRLQHRVVARHRLVAESAGSGAARHLVVYPG